MAKRFAKFTAAYEGSPIPFLLAEVITNGSGEMVELACRYANEAAAALLGVTPGELSGQRFTKKLPADRLAFFRPLASVAFSGSAASLDYTTVLGAELTISCYQLQYGLCACILNERKGHTHFAALSAAELTAQSLPGGTAVLELGRQGLRLLSCSAQLYTLLGYSERDFMNRFFGDPAALLPLEERKDALQLLLDAAHEGNDLSGEIRLLESGGEPHWFSLRTKYISNQSGGTILYVVLLDIQQSKCDQQELLQAKADLQEMRTRFERLFDAPSGGCCLFHQSADGAGFQLQRVNQGFEELLGYPPAEILKRLRVDLLWRVYSEDRAGLKDAYEKALQSHQPLRHSFRVQKKGGEARWLSMIAVPQECSDGGWDCYAVFTDVTEERESEKELRFRSELSELLLSRPNSVSIDYDPLTDSARFELFDAEGRRASHIVPEYRKGIPASITIHPDDRKAIAAELRRACSRPGKGGVSYRGNYLGESFRWYQAVFVSLADADGNVFRIAIKCEDISAQKAAQASFAQKSARWEQLDGNVLAAVRMDLTDDRLLNVKADTPYLMRVLFGNTASECMDSIRQSLAEEADGPAFSSVLSRELLLDAFQRGQVVPAPVFRLRTDASDTRWVRFEWECAENPDNLHLECGCRLVDIDEEKRQDDVLQALGKQGFAFVVTIDTQTRYYRVYGHNGALSQTAGPDFYRAALDQIESRIAPEDRKALRSTILLPNVLRHLKQKPFYAFSATATSGDGQAMHLLMRFSRLDADTLLLTGLDVTAFAQSHQKRQDALSAALSAAEGAEENKLRFLSRLADEVRVPLETIRTAVSEAGGKIPEDSLESILQNVQYLQLLTDDLMDITRMERQLFRLQEEPFSLQAVLEQAGALPLLSQKRIAYSVSVSPDVGDRLMGDSENLLKILQNLLANAVRFTSAGGRVTLGVQRAATADGQSTIEFQVCDTGRGITPEKLPGLFEPFAHTGSADQSSTGLGLAISRGLAEAMGGTLNVSSIPGVGSRFTLTLPLASDDTPKGLAGKQLLAVTGNAAFLEALKAAGAEVDVLPDGLQALQTFVAREDGWFSAVILDAKAPAMDGAHTAAAIRGWDKQDAASIPIFVLGGNPDGDFSCLPESAQPETLLQTVMDAL